MHRPKKPHDAAFPRLRDAVSLDVEQQNVNLARVLRGDQVLVGVRPPGVSVDRRHPVVNVVAATRAQESLRQRVHHLPGQARPGSAAVRPPIPVRHPQRYRRFAVRDHLTRGGGDEDEVSVIVQVSEVEPVALGDSSL